MHISEFLSRVTINILTVASFTRPIKYCAGYNEESSKALLRFGKKITRVSTCFGMVLWKQQSYTTT